MESVAWKGTIDLLLAPVWISVMACPCSPPHASVPRELHFGNGAILLSLIKQIP